MELNTSEPPAQTPSKLTYSVENDGYNEAVAPDGTTRPHWQYLLNCLNELGQENISARYKTAKRILRDDGTSYLKRSNQPTQMHWPLDPIPFIVDSKEWNSIEMGIIERAELMNLVLRDIYGPMECVHQGILPKQLLLSHHGYLRTIRNEQGCLFSNQPLINYAVEMTRSPSGEMQVLNDRVQIPTGLGYTLEHRKVLSRTFPSMFRESHVHRIFFFYQLLRQSLFNLKPNVSVPRTVLLTPGLNHINYFEHAMLANYFGFILVQSSDLTVRDCKVWLKSIEGLLEVDIIFRFVEDTQLDPLELDSQSRFGIAGLLEAIRQGHVVVANPPGVSVIENPGLNKYISELSQFFLGRQPRLSSIPTYWCGDENDYHYVLSHISELMIKPINYRSHITSSKTIKGHTLSPSEIEALKQQIAFAPHLYVAHPFIQAPQTPAWDNKLVSRPLMIRAFGVLNNNSYQILPGGLGRIGPESGSELAGCYQKLKVKDIWVTASEPTPHTSTNQKHKKTSTLNNALGNDLPSRVIENLFWLGRYSERAESSLRLIRTVFFKIHESDEINDSIKLTLLQAISEITSVIPDLSLAETEPNNASDNELINIVIDTNRPGSVASCLISLLQAAKQIKDTLSSDTQRIINDLDDQLQSLQQNFHIQSESAPEAVFDPIVTTLLALSGVCRDSMVRGFGWQFLDSGKRLERSLQTITLLKSALISCEDENNELVVIESILLSAEALSTFQRRYQNRLNILNVLDFLLFDANNPRSIMFQLNILNSHLKTLPHSSSLQHLPTHLKHLLRARTELQLANLNQLVTLTDYKRECLLVLLEKIYNHLLNTAKSISDRYFDHTADQQLFIH